MVTLAAFIWERGLALALTRGDPDPGRRMACRRSSTTRSPASRITAPIVVVAYLVGWWLLTRTRMGRYTYAMGGDPAAARRARIDVPRYTLLVFAAHGPHGRPRLDRSSSASSRRRSRTSRARLGLDAIIAVIIGGTRLMGGEGSLGRTALGVAFISILNSGLLNLGTDQDAYYQLYKGAILLAVLAVQIWLRRLADRHASGGGWSARRWVDRGDGVMDRGRRPRPRMARTAIVAVDIARCALPLERPVHIGRTIYHEREYVAVRGPTSPTGPKATRSATRAGCRSTRWSSALATELLGARRRRPRVARRRSSMAVARQRDAGSLWRAISLRGHRARATPWRGSAGLPLWRTPGGARTARAR